MSRPPLAVLAREDPAARPAGREQGLAVTGGASDEDLMARVAAGDHVAFRGLMARHMRRAIRITQGILGSAADADDVAQEAFLRVWKKAGSFDPARARFTIWMHKIVVNLAIDGTRAPRTEPIEHAEHVHDGAPDALITLMDAQERHTMQQALARLSEHHRAAITLFHFEGLSGRDSAQAMSLSEAAFESLLTRARAMLKQHVRAALGNRARRA
jgi:RNA polymerase sigma-70 factor, ECF subfamily